MWKFHTFNSIIFSDPVIWVFIADQDLNFPASLSKEIWSFLRLTNIATVEIRLYVGRTSSSPRINFSRGEDWGEGLHLNFFQRIWNKIFLFWTPVSKLVGKGENLKNPALIFPILPWPLLPEEWGGFCFTGCETWEMQGLLEMFSREDFVQPKKIFVRIQKNLLLRINTLRGEDLGRGYTLKFQ